MVEYNGVGGVFCIFAQFSVGYACRGDRIKGGLLNIGTLTLCSLCWTVLHTRIPTMQLDILHSIVRSLSEGQAVGKEVSDDKDIRP